MNDPAANNNVVSLHKNLDQPSIKNIEDAIETAKQIKTDISDDLTDVVMENAMGMLTTYGIIADNNRVDTRDIIMLETAIQSMIYRYYGIEHPLHEVTEEVIKIEEEETDGE